MKNNKGSIKPWMISNLALFIILVLIGIQNYLLISEIDVLKGEMIELKEELIKQSETNQNETKILAEDSGLHAKIILGSVSVIAIVVIISYLGGIEPGSLGDAINSLGDQMTVIAKNNMSNLTEKTMSIHQNNSLINENVKGVETRLTSLINGLGNQLSQVLNNTSIDSLFKRNNNNPLIIK